ncbi:hypothetical protein MOTE_17770 [Moorella thermoacetica]|uniref:Uncharacterized protein n=1 Tax=Neomoorella thermoacetica TaxID=1525 RepID=A0A1J5P3S0_NEOTH|nr:hypothetical protein MOTE_17770 [Moorella thermoacetica]
MAFTTLSHGRDTRVFTNTTCFTGHNDRVVPEVDAIGAYSQPAQGLPPRRLAGWARAATSTAVATDSSNSLSFVFQLALLVAAYLEYRVRKSLEQEESPLILPGKRKSTNPTARALLEMFDYLLVVKQGSDRALINYQGPEVIRALELAGFGKEIYLFPPRGGG